MSIGHQARGTVGNALNLAARARDHQGCSRLYPPFSDLPDWRSALPPGDILIALQWSDVMGDLHRWPTNCLRKGPATTLASELRRD
jgi:hypothetical protein